MRSPARANVKSADSGDDVQTAGRFKVRRPVTPAGALLTTSTVMATDWAVAPEGTIAVRGVWLTATAGTTRSSRSCSPYGTIARRRIPTVRRRTVAPATSYRAPAVSGGSAAGRNMSKMAPTADRDSASDAPWEDGRADGVP